MIHTPQRKPEMEMPLCSFCASFYYENKKYWIERSDSKQKKLDVCMICRNRHGYDFKIWNLHKRYSSKRIIDKEVHHG